MKEEEGQGRGKAVLRSTEVDDFCFFRYILYLDDGVLGERQRGMKHASDGDVLYTAVG